LAKKEEQNLNFTLISNCGKLLADKGYKLLVDSDELSPFDVAQW
jgi:hypothetical protein